MALLNRDAFKKRAKASGIVIGEVSVPALGGTVHIRKLSAGGRDRVQHALFNGKSESYRARLVKEATCDDNGKLLFTDDDLPWLSDLDYDVLEPIVDQAHKLNEYDKPEEQEKNCSNPPTEGSPSV